MYRGKKRKGGEEKGYLESIASRTCRVTRSSRKVQSLRIVEHGGSGDWVCEIPLPKM